MSTNADPGRLNRAEVFIGTDPLGKIEDYRRGIETGVMTNATPNVVRQLIAIIDTIRRDIPGLHRRKCRGCGKPHWHAQNRTPVVLCPECGMQERIGNSLMTAREVTQEEIARDEQDYRDAARIQ